jgi:lipopolysaccharide transport system permease protein
MAQVPAHSEAVSWEQGVPLEDPTDRLIAPAKRRLRLRDIPREVPVIRVLARRDFKVKYKQSLLGPLWLVFQPLALLVAFLVAFRGLGKVQSSSIPYLEFTLIGLSAWTFFQASMTIGTASIITNASFVRYTPCPRAAFPLAGIITSLPAFALTGVVGLAGAAITGNLSPRVLLLPLGLAWLAVLTASLVGVTAALAVRYRDMLSALPFLLQVGVFLAPVGYSLAALSPTVRHIEEINPLTGLIEALRWMVFSGYSPSVFAIVLDLVLTALCAVLGWRVFSGMETTMADEI